MAGYLNFGMNGSAAHTSWWDEEVTGSDLVKGFAAGALGGFVACWVMNRYQALSHRLRQSTEKEPEIEEQGRQMSQEQQEEPATVKATKAVSRTVFGHHLSQPEKRVAGPVVHYAYGTVMGGVYGALAEAIPATTAGGGLAYATALWAGGDEIALPAFGLSQAPADVPLTDHADAMVAHFVYGLTTECVRASVRELFDGHAAQSSWRDYLPRRFRREPTWSERMASLWS